MGAIRFNFDFIHFFNTINFVNTYRYHIYTIEKGLNVSAFASFLQYKT